MKRIDPTVIRETGFVLSVEAILSALMQSVFLILRQWSLPVLWGNLLGASAAVLHFFLLGLTVQAALGKEEKEARSLMRLSQSLRLLMLLAVALVGYLVPVFHLLAVVIPFLFPRIAVALRAFLIKK